MSNKTMVQKLLIKPGYRVVLLYAPASYADSLNPLPEGVSVTSVTMIDEAAGPADLIQLFVTSREELEARLGQVKGLLSPKGLLWVTYPKGTSRIKTDIHRDSINAFAQTLGLQGIAIIAVDDTWSSLRLKVV